MPPTNDQKQYLLTEEHNQLLFSDIWLDTESDSTPVTKPIALFLGGQPGSGKSSLAQFHLQQFADRGGVVLVNSDALREYHPNFADLQRTDADRASFLVNPDTVVWQQKLISAAVENKRNLLLDGTLGGNSAPILATMQRLRSEGYSIQVSVLAVPAEQSRLGIYKRYEDQLLLKGSGRWVGMKTHNRVFDEIPQNLVFFEQQSVLDQIQLYARPQGLAKPALLYDNKRIDRHWQHPVAASKILYQFRNQWLTQGERDAHNLTWGLVRMQMVQRGAGNQELNAFMKAISLPQIVLRLATPNDSKRYFEWANDPVTRQQSFNSTSILWEDHQLWFTRKMADSNALLLVSEVEGTDPIGQIRFERKEDGEVVVGVSVDVDSRGLGNAAGLIIDGCAACRAVWGNVPITAYIKPDNVASVRSFERAGFVKEHSSQSDRLRLVRLS